MQITKKAGNLFSISCTGTQTSKKTPNAGSQIARKPLFVDSSLRSDYNKRSADPFYSVRSNTYVQITIFLNFLYHNKMYYYCCGIMSTGGKPDLIICINYALKF